MEEIKVSENDNLKRLDVFLVEKLNESRSFISKNIKNGNILVNNKKVKSGYLLKIGDVVHIKDLTQNISMPEKGTYKGDDTYMSGSITLSDYTIRDWNKIGWGEVTFDYGYMQSSNIGIANINIGTTNDVNVTFLNPNRAITEIIYPKNILPESPINILAG